MPVDAGSPQTALAWPARAGKRQIQQEADAGMAHAQLGVLLRREGLYSSHLETWRRQRDQGILEGLGTRSRGPKPDPLARENDHLRHEIQRLQAQLKRAETIIEVQKKLSQMLGLPSPSRAMDDDA